MQIYVNELNYVLDQNKKLQNDADAIDPPAMPSITRKFCHFTCTILCCRLFITYQVF